MLKERYTYVTLWIVVLITIPGVFQGCGTLPSPREKQNIIPQRFTFDKGLKGVSLHLVTASAWTPFYKGMADHISYEYDDNYDTKDVDFFNLKDPKLMSVSEKIHHHKRFYLILANGQKNDVGYIKINDQYFTVREYQQSTDLFLKGHTTALPAFTLGDPKFKKDIQLKNLQLIYSTQTQNDLKKISRMPIRCVYNNHPNKQGQYRNGALVFQLIDAEALYFMKKTNTASQRGGLLWELSVFRDGSQGPCYKKSF